MNREFIERLNIAFDHETMADVARRLKIPHATVRNYYQGRLPAPEVLIKIANETGVSLNWLLTGAGERYAGEISPIGLGKFIEEKIGQMIDAKLAAARIGGSSKKSLPAVPEFDIAAAVMRLDDPQMVMREWFAFEGREYPSDFGVVFFRGWETFSHDDKIAAVTDTKRAIDRTLGK
jgi:transcriptional regulator with XRE-family HTH domain